VGSIRTYLLTRLVACTGLVLALAGVGLYLAVTRALESQFDRNLTDRVRGFASILFQVEDRVEFQFSEQLMPEYERGERPAYFELWFRDGTLLERSESLEGADLALGGEPGASPMHWTAALPDGRTGRYVAQLLEVHHVFPEEGPERPEAKTVLVVVARGREELVAAERRVLVTVGLSFLVLIGLVAVFARLAVQRGLAPAQRFAAELDALHVERLPARFEAGALPRELAPVAKKTDALIRRVGAALDRERRTSADIAHELRTPLSEILTVAEVELRAGDASEATRKALATIRDVAARMGRTVSTLLELARLETGARTFERTEVDLGALAAELLPSLSGALRARRVELRCELERGQTVTGAVDALRIVLSNLLANAVQYATPGTAVSCRLQRASAWRLVVENETEELAPADLSALTEPFWRKDRARGDRDHSGLGLALSRALAEGAGLALSFELEGRKFRALLTERAR
jgi:two-component system sensor histidine kinase QseC